jgi:hypothetical protein
MKKILIILLLTQINLFAQEYHPFKGKVVDLETQLPLQGVHIRIGNIGISTNEKGDFLLKIPTKLWGSTLTVSSIGYKNFTQKISNSDTLVHTIALESSSTALSEVKVYSSAAAIVKSAFNQIESNYFSSPTLLKGFYREVSQDPNTLNYKYLAEAVLEVFKPSYQSSSDGTVHILQARKKEFIVLDSMQTFFNSGTFLPITFDIVHNKIFFIDPKYIENFTFKIQDVTTLDNQDVYVISFNPKNEAEASLFGKLYINTQDNAFVGIDFESNNAALIKGSKEKSKTATIFKGKETKVRYQKLEGKYYLQSVAHIMTLHRLMKGKEEDFKLSLEFTTTDIETQNVKKNSNIPKAHRSDVFLKVVGAMDEDFWGNYTTVLQNIPLQEQLSKLSKDTFHK